MAGLETASVRRNTIPARIGLCARWEAVKILEVFIREGVWITGDKHSGTNTAKIEVSDCFSRTVNIVTKKNQKMAVRLFFWMPD